MDVKPRTASPTTIPGLPGHTYRQTSSYSIPVEVLLSPADRSGHALILSLSYSVLGYRRDGTTATDAELGALYGVSPKTLSRARTVLIDCDAIEPDKRDRDRRTRRRSKCTGSYVLVKPMLMRAAVERIITPFELRVMCAVIHLRGETGELAGCALTVPELAKRLSVTVERVSAAIRQLGELGFITVQGRCGVGMILTPRTAYAFPVKRPDGMDPKVMHQMRARRERWKLSRPVIHRGPGPRTSRDPVRVTSPGPVQPAPTPAGPSPQVAQRLSPEPVNEESFNEGKPPAGWRSSLRSAVLSWRERKPDVAPRPSGLDWRAFRPAAGMA